MTCSAIYYMNFEFFGFGTFWKQALQLLFILSIILKQTVFIGMSVVHKRNAKNWESFIIGERKGGNKSPRHTAAHSSVHWLLYVKVRIIRGHWVGMSSSHNDQLQHFKQVVLMSFRARGFSWSGEHIHTLPYIRTKLHLTSPQVCCTVHRSSFLISLYNLF
jgi:hypothetical protein